MDLNARLSRLEGIFGKKITLVDPPDEDPKEPELDALSTEQHVQEKPAQNEPLTTQVKVPVTEDLDVPKKFLTHDTGPRASVTGVFDCTSFQFGVPTDEDMEFCPWKVIRAYPSCFVGKTNRPHVEPYFDKICEGRVWDFFYLYHPTKPRDKPYLFVPTSQFQVFLDWINKELGIALAIPGGANSDRFFMKFGAGGTPRPRYLKRLQNTSEFNISSWPDINSDEAKSFMNVSGILQQDWEDKFALISMAPAKNKQKKESKAAERRVDCDHMLDETQTLLCLKQGRVNGLKPGNTIIFVCIDVEALERPPNPISEIGIVLLDGQEIRKVSRGPCGSNWWDLFQCYHLRTKEYSGLVNHEFIQGCPDAFDFGTSTFPSRTELAEAIISILRPFMKPSVDMVLVGHDTKQDIQYMASVGLDITEMPCFSRILDTQAIHQAWKQSDNGRGLEGVLNDLGIFSKNLHNAGNDAVYTLRALIGVAIEHMRQHKAELLGENWEPELWSVGRLDTEEG